MLFVGGRRSIIGAVVGALAVQYVSGASEWVSVNILLVEGALITVVLLVDPEGLAGIVATLRARLGAWLRERRRERRPVRGAGRDGCRRRRGRRRGAVRVTDWEPAARRRARPRRHARGPRLARSRRRPLLECSGVSKDYGGLHVLDAVTLSLGPGPLRAVRPEWRGQVDAARRHRGHRGPVGRTGAARRHRRDRAATAAALLPGHEPHVPGGAPDHGAHRAGQRRGLLPAVATSSIAAGIARSRLDEARDKAAEALDYLGMRGLAGREVSSLTLESQRMVEFARAIAPQPGCCC